MTSLTPLQSLLLRRWRPQWQCDARRASVFAAWGLRHLSTEEKQPKPYYITTPIFYVNAAPHVGHMYTMVLADVMKRWQQLRGRTAILSTGIDEHGLKVQQAAQKAGSEPQAFCDQGAAVFSDLANRIDISYDHFVRTTDPKHKEAVEYAWMILEDKGYIYKTKHQGWYSVSDEAYYTDAGVHVVMDPRTGQKYTASKETGNEVVWSSEENYHFRLSAFKHRLLKFYSDNSKWITPRSQMSSVIIAVKAGLEDLSISRPSSRLHWAVTVPTDSSQSVYVWLDALLNYATKVGYPWTPGTEKASGWPADVHVIGKDIIRFHCIYWPAFLMALDLPLPKRIMTHAHWTMDNRKMSKSIGNVVNPFWAMDRFGVETMRYFLIHHAALHDDSDYDNKIVAGRYKTDLQDRLGNLLSRVLNSSMFDPRALNARYAGKPDLLARDCAACASLMPTTANTAPGSQPDHAVNWDFTEYRDMLERIPQQTQELFELMQPNKAVQGFMSATYAANAFYQNNAPWTLHKNLLRLGAEEHEKREELETRLSCIMFLMMETLRFTGILLQPVIPKKAAELLDLLGVDKDRRGFEDLKLCEGGEYGIIREKGVKVKPLFPALVNPD